MKSVLESRSVQDRIIAYLDKTNYPSRRKLRVVASILGMSTSQIRPALDALERAGRLEIDRWKGSLVLNTSNRVKARQRDPVAKVRTNVRIDELKFDKPTAKR
jgi:DNA-binding FadR family transcriptional regulator